MLCCFALVCITYNLILIEESFVPANASWLERRSTTAQRVRRTSTSRVGETEKYSMQTDLGKYWSFYAIMTIAMLVVYLWSQILAKFSHLGLFSPDTSFLYFSNTN